MKRQVHPETREILLNAREAWLKKEIDDQQYNEVVLHCFEVEAEYEILGKYPEAQNRTDGSD